MSFCSGLINSLTVLLSFPEWEKYEMNGLDRFVYDPDKTTTLRLLQEHLRQLPQVPPPQLDKWCDNLDKIPQKYGYGSIVEFLIKRQARILSINSTDAMVPLPTADKPLVKGYNFFASGHVGEIHVLVNDDNGIVHVKTTVLASMRETRYDVSCVLQEVTGLVISAACKCPAGSAGKCNHVAALLFAMMDFVKTMRVPESCTSRPQTWHRPQRKTKRATRPAVVGKRKVKKHIYGQEKKRKGPLSDYADFCPLVEVVQPNHAALMRDLKELHANHHSIGLFQVMDSSTDTASSDEDEGNENATPEEVVVSRLQVFFFLFEYMDGNGMILHQLWWLVI